MKTPLNCIKYIIAFIFINFIIYSIAVHRIRNSDYDYDNQLNIIDNIKLFYHKSFCQCKIDEIVSLEKKQSGDYSVNIFNNTKGEKVLKYDLSRTEYLNLKLTCDAYKSLRRGYGQKVISLSFLSDDNINYGNVKLLATEVKKLHPDWIIRIYHNKSVSSFHICDLECLREDNQQILDNLDFCDVNNLNEEYLGTNLIKPNRWKLLPIGDSFVDVFLTDEIDQNVFDEIKNSSHYSNLDTLKGFFNIRDRKLAADLFEKLGNS